MSKGDRMAMIGIAAVTAAVIVLWLTVLQKEIGEEVLIGSKERVRILAPAGKVEAVAKIDTGADLSAIDDDFAKKIGLKIDRSDRKRIRSAKGMQRRATTRLTFILGSRTISTVATVTERGRLTTDLLIGRTDLEGFRIDPSREFLSDPEKARAPSEVDRFLRDVFRKPGTKDILVFTILGSLVVVLRIIFGVTTYGIFAPTVIAFSLIDIDILVGTLLYAFLVTVGISAKQLVLARFRLPHLAELSILMFILAMALFIISAALRRSPFPVTADVFFPLIITSYLIERASKTAEEHRLRSALSLLTVTVVTATLLAAIAKLLLAQRLTTIWGIFFIAFVVVVATGKYTGLRLSEIFRFKFLRRGHGDH